MEHTIEIPQGVQVSVQGNKVTVKGSKGEIARDFRYPRTTITLNGNTLTVKGESDRKKDKAVVGTWRAHINNMIYGVTKGYSYKMKIVFMHFPMTVKVEGKTIIINNFLGEKGPRKTTVVGDDVKVNVGKEEITVTGIDVEHVGQTAANIERACYKSKKDVRVFQDGIYITEKA